MEKCIENHREYKCFKETMADKAHINENSQELEEGEINDDFTADTFDEPEKHPILRHISLHPGITDVSSDKRLFGCTDIDSRTPERSWNTPKAKGKKPRKRKNMGFSRNPSFGDRTQGSNPRSQKNSSKVQSFRSHTNSLRNTPRSTQCQNFRPNNRRNSGGMSKGRGKYFPRQQYNKQNVPQCGRTFTPQARLNTYPSNMGKPKNLNSVDKEASYEDLLDQYKLIKMELGRLKKEEAKLTERESERGNSESRHGRNDKENKHHSRHYSRSPTKGKSRSPRSDSVLLVKNDKFGKRHSPLKAETQSSDTQRKEVPKSPNEEEEDEMELRRMALASRNIVNNKNDTNLADSGYKDTYPKRRHSRENSNQKINTQSMDNYESVDMDLDSDCLAQATDLSEVEMDTSDDNQETVQEDDDDEMLLREQLLRSLQRRRNLAEVQETNISAGTTETESASPAHQQFVTEVPEEVSTVKQHAQHKQQGTIPETVNSNAAPTLTLRPLPSLVINLAEDSSSDESDSEKVQSASPTKGNLLDGLDSLLRDARRKTETAMVGQTTPAALSKLSKAQQLEYRKLKAEIAKRELHQPPKAVLQPPVTTQNVLEQNSEISTEAASKEQKLQLETCEQKLITERWSLAKGKEHLGMLQQLVNKRKRLVDMDNIRLEKLREEMSVLEANVAKNTSYLTKISNLVQRARTNVSKHILAIPKLERECNRLGRISQGPHYRLPPTSPVSSKLNANKRRAALVSGPMLNVEKKQKLGVSISVTVNQPVRSSAELLAEKVRLQRMEQEIAHRLEELRMRSNAGSPKPLPRKVMNNCVKSPVPRQFTLVQIQENGNASPEVTQRKELNDIHLISTYDIQMEPIKENLANELKGDVVNLNEKFSSRIAQTEPTLSPLDSYTDNSSFQPLSVPERKLTFSSLGERNKMDVLRSERLLTRSSGHKLYSSCLLHCSSYRLNPRFRVGSSQSLSCNSFTSKVNVKVQLCKFDLTGTCNDDQCKWQHSRNYISCPVDIVVDLLSFCPELAGVCPQDNSEKCQEKLYKHANVLLKGSTKDLEEVLEQLCKDVCTHLGITQPHFVQLYKRSQRLRPAPAPLPSDPEETNKTIKAGQPYSRLFHGQDEDSVVDPETDVRYFESEKGLNSLEDFLLQNPQETKLWLKLASHYMNSSNGGVDTLSRALDVLSRALETNREDVELWQSYLTLFSGHPDSKDILSLCQQALIFTKHYSIWWKYLELSVGFQSKCQVCHDLLSHLLSPEGSLLNSDPADLSHRLLETFLYLLQLHIQTGRTETALALLRASLLTGDGSAEEGNRVDGKWSLLKEVPVRLTGSDLVLAWLCLVHLQVHGSLPPCLFQGSTNQPSILSHKELFVISWPTETEADSSWTSLLTQGISCCNERASPDLCWPLYKSLFHLHLLLQRSELAVAECRNLCEKSPSLLQAWTFLSSLYLKDHQQDEAEKVLQDAVKHAPQSPQLCNILATFYFCKGCTADAIATLRKCVRPYFGLPNSLQEEEEEPTALLYKLLLNHHYGEDVPLLLLERQNNQKFSEEETTYLWLNYVLYLQCAQVFHSTIVDAFEAAIVSVDQQANMELLWWRYLEYTLGSKETNPVQAQELVFQCLRRLPASRPLAHWPGRKRLNYRFHNSVIHLYCQALSSLEEKSAFCQEMLQRMPRNEQLLQRLTMLVLEEEGPRSALETLTAHLGPQVASPIPWRIAISLAYKEDDLAEVRKLYHRALKVIPYTRCLWLDLLTLEGPEKVQALRDRCQELGILTGNKGDS